MYHGSNLFQDVAQNLGLPLDQFNFITAQLMAIFFGFIFRNFMKPCPKNTLRRHLCNITLGIALGHYCYGRQMWHLFFQAFIVYLGFEFCPRNYVHLFTFVFAIGYLSALHIYRLIHDYGNYTLDITGAVMISTQKLTSMAFAYYDGMRPSGDLNQDQKNLAIKKVPSLIEFLSYIFNFQGIIVGPLCTYSDYIEFVNGENVLKHRKNTDSNVNEEQKISRPSAAFIVFKKMVYTFILSVIFFKVTIVYPLISSVSEKMLKEPLWYRIIYYYVAAGSQRVKYYMAWTLADAVNNASGLGFNGYDANGNPRWDLVTNVHIVELEMATSIKSVFDHWNIGTQVWFRRIAYDRLPTGKTLGVFVLSAFWHGFYPGYYMTFVLCAFMVYAGRGIRRKIRPFFQTSRALIVVYAGISWFVTIGCINYSAASFDILEMQKSFDFYSTWYWVPHLITIVLACILPGGSTKRPKKTAPADATETETAKKLL